MLGGSRGGVGLDWGRLGLQRGAPGRGAGWGVGGAGCGCRYGMRAGPDAGAGMGCGRGADPLAQGRLRALAAALGGCGLLLGSALAAGDERLYAAAVMPALRAIPPETAHGLALRAAAFGLLPPARPDGPALVRFCGGGDRRWGGQGRGWWLGR